MCKSRAPQFTCGEFNPDSGSATGLICTTFPSPTRYWFNWFSFNTPDLSSELHKGDLHYIRQMDLMFWLIGVYFLLHIYGTELQEHCPLRSRVELKSPIPNNPNVQVKSNVARHVNITTFVLHTSLTFSQESMLGDGNITVSACWSLVVFPTATKWNRGWETNTFTFGKLTHCESYVVQGKSRLFETLTSIIKV